ncbi:glycosyl hydrolase family 95 catalytic domain-containing protein [Saccharothrix deserti]|uniref:glycosyl hydrolase family 95 catalytic domain-containing protein n=1 Tax=Saccharothrix deserti TaxID=2593674 RepID=UPI00131DA693|nr:Tat pathway signal sequence domain protein [Saccharothrix deserti]
MNREPGEAGFSRRALLGATLAGTAGAVVGTSAAVAAGADGTGSLVRADVRWDRFLADADPLWQRMPKAWYEGPFLGNALLGSMVYAQPGANAVRFTVSHSEVQDHRPRFGSLFGLARLPIGHLTLEPVGAITGVDWRLDLWNAELRGTITTAAGSLALRALVHDSRSVLVVEVTPTEGEAAFRWNFHPEEAVSPRADPVFGKPPPEGYVANPPPVVRRGDGMEVVVQPLLAGGQHVTAWREVSRGRTRTLYATVAWSFPDTTAEDRAVQALRRAAVLPAAALVPDHRAWWHRYYRRSFLSLPDARVQSFYWIQLYKIASAARREAPVMATCGPWLEPTPWPAVWWNLNVQLQYWMIHGSNHPELDAVTRSLHQFRANLVEEVDERYRADSAGIPRTTDMTLLNGAGTGTSGFPVGIPGQASPVPEVGNLTWALHNVWLSYRHSMDIGVLRDVVFPLLRRSINYYLHFLTPGPDGRLHLPFTSSPEYGTNAPDCNYDLALIRWGCRTLLESAATLGVDDPLAPRWREVLATLVDYPVDANGYMIGAGVPFAKSHRHYSHLLMVYPLHEVTGERPEDRALIERSLRHWISFEGALQGYSFTGAASISALLSRGDDARFYLSELLRRYVQPNTMYKESGPVIETPLSAGQSLHDMVCQSWGGVIRVFPAVPADWRDLAVHDFRTRGAFLLSAVRRAGRTEFVRLTSLAGAPCVLRVDIPGPLSVRSSWGREVPWRVLPGGDMRIDVRRGEEVVVHARGRRPDLHVEPVSPDVPAPAWGLPT